VTEQVLAGSTLVRTRTLGRLRIHALEAGLQRLDGGAMFGVVPKPLWEKRIPADARNRIPLALRCLLVETPDELVLIETGLGNKENEKFADIYGVDNAASDPRFPDRLHEAIAAAGFSAGDVGVVIDTHLHFDHAGGNTYRDTEGQVRLAFPNAAYHVQRGEWEWAHHTNERTSASYIPHNYDPVMEAGRMTLVDGDVEIVPGISVYRTRPPRWRTCRCRGSWDTTWSRW
jgi:glyoxylase-like metal-dependent hydrolase (beta-lactamase superfamily II)